VAFTLRFNRRGKQKAQRLSLTEITEDTEKRGIMGVKKGIYLSEITKGTEGNILGRKKLCASACSVREEK